MPKDLRGFLEPPRDASKNKETQSSVPLAHRRGLTSPGEPRVFQVRSGFVCGLCGQVHKNLERAFDCLGRCTVQLRLRSPAGPKLCGSQAHFSCTACGRGYANCDDAEQCFERCLHRLKPTPEFEAALRKVQVRYAQRLASHGVRHLERIDPLKEHTRMLETLTKEQAALVDSALSQEQKVKNPVQGSTAPLKESSQLPVAEPDLSTAEPDLSTAEPDLSTAEPDLSTAEPELSTAEPELSAAEPELSTAEPELGAAEPELSAHLSESVSDLLEATTPQLDALDETNEVSLPESKLSSAEVPWNDESSADALGSLELDEFAITEGTLPEQASQNLLDNSDFATLGSEGESEAGLGEDVFAMLQDNPAQVEEKTRTKGRSSLQRNVNAIDGDLLDDLMSTDADSRDFETVFVRRADMKPYRREHAKYCCSACSKEFLTKEQVEACFFSHPEEGSEEERLLLEKVAKLKNKSAA